MRKSYGDPIADDLRFVVKSVVGEENFVDMTPNKSNNYCCGGGGGRIWMDTPKEERFSDLRLAQAKQVGAELLVTITNDGWYGRSSAPYQHFNQAVLRAVENRRYLVRAATTGISTRWSRSISRANSHF